MQQSLFPEPPRLPGSTAAIGRLLGQAYYAKLVPWLRSQMDQEVLRFRVPPVLIDVGFADETVGQLLSEFVEGTWGDRYLQVAVDVPQQLENVMAAVRSRGLSARIAMGDQLHVSTGVRGQEELVETLALVDRYRRITASELTREHGLSLTAWNNRLVRAWKARLIRRQQEPVPGGPRAFTYVALWELCDLPAQATGYPAWMDDTQATTTEEH